MAANAQRLNTAPGAVNGKRKLNLTPYLFILPHLIFFGVFVGYPFFNGLWISLHQYDFARPEATRFIGLDNYVTLFQFDLATFFNRLFAFDFGHLFVVPRENFRFYEFWNALINTFEFVILSVPPLVILPLLLAILLNTKTPGRNAFRAVYFSPWVLSAAVVGLLWWWIFQSAGGLVNYYWGQLFQPFLTAAYFLLKFIVPPLVLIALVYMAYTNIREEGSSVSPSRVWFFLWLVVGVVLTILAWLAMLGAPYPGAAAPNWLSSMPWAWVAIVVCTVWWIVGFNMIILLAALQDIPEFLYEAAAIDGATGIQAFFRVTLPMLRPVLVFIITITIISSFNLFAQPLFMTRGGQPQEAGGIGGATEPIMLRIFNEGFALRTFQGSAAAMSFVVAIIMVIVSFINFRVFREREE